MSGGTSDGWPSHPAQGDHTAEGGDFLSPAVYHLGTLLPGTPGAVTVAQASDTQPTAQPQGWLPLVTASSQKSPRPPLSASPPVAPEAPAVTPHIVASGS